MSNKNKWGFIFLWRKLRKHWLWEEKRSRTKFEAWVDLLWSASHEERKILIDNNLITLGTGQRNLSFRFLAVRWKWSVGKVQRFISMLENDMMISTETSTGQMIITICNYESYQKGFGKNDTLTGTPTGTRTGTDTIHSQVQPQVQREELNNNYNNSKQLKEKDHALQVENKNGIGTETHTKNDIKYTLDIWKKIHERFNLHMDSYNAYTGLIFEAFRRLGKDRVEFGVTNFLNDDKSKMKNITYFFKTGVDSYLIKTEINKDQKYLDRMKRLEDMI